VLGRIDENDRPLSRRISITREANLRGTFSVSKKRGNGGGYDQEGLVVSTSPVSAGIYPEFEGSVILLNRYITPRSPYSHTAVKLT
jgi:hypothetical protein